MVHAEHYRTSPCWLAEPCYTSLTLLTRKAWKAKLPWIGVRGSALRVPLVSAAEVVQLQLRDWLPTTFRGESFRFYVERLDTALQQLYEEHGPVAIVGHSAGGWVPRILLGDQPYEGRLEIALAKSHMTFSVMQKQ